MSSRKVIKTKAASHSLTEEMQYIESELDKLNNLSNFESIKKKFLKCLSKFRETLTAHFTDEEDDGFMKEIIDSTPEHRYEILKLIEEHQCIAKYLEEIIEDMESKEPAADLDMAPLRSRIIHLLDRLKKHEIDENDLIQHIYYQEYGYPS